MCCDGMSKYYALVCDSLVFFTFGRKRAGRLKSYKIPFHRVRVSGVELLSSLMLGSKRCG